MFHVREEGKSERHTERRRKEGEADNGRQRGENHSTIKLLHEPSRQIDLDAACRISSVPIALHDSRSVEVGPAQLANGGVAILIDDRPSRYWT